MSVSNGEIVPVKEKFSFKSKSLRLLLQKDYRAMGILEMVTPKTRLLFLKILQEGQEQKKGQP